jgi:hypothetical protein
MIVPANELVPFTEKQLSGTTSRSGVRTGVRGGVGFSSGGSKRFRHVNLRLCANCADIRIQAIKRARFWSNVRAVVVAGAIAWAVIAFIRMKPSITSPSVNAAVADTSMNASTPAQDNLAANDSVPVSIIPADKPETAPQADWSLDSQGVPNKGYLDREASQQDRYREPPPEPARQDVIVAEINSVTPSALESGTPQKWHAEGETGYIVPSAPQAYADRVCRNVFATTVDHGEQSQSASVLWCQPKDGGDWKPAG